MWGRDGLELGQVLPPAPLAAVTHHDTLLFQP